MRDFQRVQFRALPPSQVVAGVCQNKSVDTVLTHNQSLQRTAGLRVSCKRPVRCAGSLSSGVRRTVSEFSKHPMVAEPIQCLIHPVARHGPRSAHPQAHFIVGRHGWRTRHRRTMRCRQRRPAVLLRVRVHSGVLLVAARRCRRRA